MGSGEAEVSMASQGINTTIQVADTTVQTIMQLMLKEQPQLRNPEALIVDIQDIDKVLNELNTAGIPWTTSMERVPIYKKDEYGQNALGTDGRPIVIGHEERVARTPDGMNCIIMVSGHDRPLIDPDTGEPVLTAKGNVKMTGGNIDQAVAIRNSVREERRSGVLEPFNLSKDDNYKGDYVKLDFPGLESRAQFIKTIKDVSATGVIIPTDNTDYSVYIRQDLFEKGQNGEQSLADRALQGYYFRQQAAPEYTDFIGRIDKDLDIVTERVNRAANEPKLCVRFGNTLGQIDFDLEDITKEKAYIQWQKGYFNLKDTDSDRDIDVYDLTTEDGRNAFISGVQETGYTFSVEGEYPSELEVQEFKRRQELDCGIIGLRNEICSLSVENEGMAIKDYVQLDYKNGDISIEPERGSSWTSMEVRVDNTPLVGQIDIDIKDGESNIEMTEKMREAMHTNVENRTTVTMVDGKSLSSALYVTEAIRNSDERSTERGSDFAAAEQGQDDIIQEKYFSDDDRGHYKDIQDNVKIADNESWLNGGYVPGIENDGFEQTDDDYEPQV